jgi:hypothetical protein
MFMIRLLRRAGGLLLLGMVVALGACASGGATSGGGQGGTALEVRNNLIPPTSVSVYADPEIGSRRLVGVVQPGATRVLRFDPTAASGQYNFVAETTSGQELVSNPITFSSGASLRWDLSSNLVTVISQ